MDRRTGERLLLVGLALLALLFVGLAWYALGGMVKGTPADWGHEVRPVVARGMW